MTSHHIRQMRGATAALFTAIVVLGCSSFQAETGAAATGADAGEVSDAGDAGGPADGDVSDSGQAGSDASKIPVDSGPPCAGNPVCERVVFVTSTTIIGNPLGFAKADSECTEVASLPGVDPRVQGREFQAWLSDNAIDAKDHLVNGTMRYVRVGGSVFAESFAAIIANEIAARLDIDERGNTVTSDALVWTGTDTNGHATAYTCTNWMGAGGGTVGSVNAVNVAFTNVTEKPCANLYHLYCFEK